MRLHLSLNGNFRQGTFEFGRCLTLSHDKIQIKVLNQCWLELAISDMTFSKMQKK